MNVVSVQLGLNLDALTHHFQALWEIILYIYDVVGVRMFKCEVRYLLQLSQWLNTYLISKTLYWRVVVNSPLLALLTGTGLGRGFGLAGTTVWTSRVFISTSLSSGRGLALDGLALTSISSSSSSSSAMTGTCFLTLAFPLPLSLMEEAFGDESASSSPSSSPSAPPSPSVPFGLGSFYDGR
jgi:hypothetical protein